MVLRIIEVYARIIVFLIKLMMGVLLLSVLIQVLGRYVPFIPRFLWTLEFVNFGLIWMVFFGSMIGVRESRHFYIDLFPDDISPKLERFLKIVYYVILYSVTYVFIRYGWGYFVDWGMSQTSDITGINLGFLYASVPISGISWFIFLTEGVYKEIRGKRHATTSETDKDESTKEE